MLNSLQKLCHLTPATLTNMQRSRDHRLALVRLLDATLAQGLLDVTCGGQVAGMTSMCKDTSRACCLIWGTFAVR
jgi:hypothetical protein